MELCFNFLYRFFISTAWVIFFYYYAKRYLFKVAPDIAIYFKITKYYSIEVAKGVIELPLMVVFHCIFVLLLLCVLSIPMDISINKIGPFIPVGIFLGIGMMGFSSLLCRAMIEILRCKPTSYFPLAIKDWLVMVRSGWLRHYFHTIEVLPFFLALFIIFCQIGCEEMMFRNVLIHYFLPIGPWAAIIGSTILFMVMQLFHMPSAVSGMFPLVGAMVIGLFNGVLYLKFFNLFPLIVAHFAFFVVAVL